MAHVKKKKKVQSSTLPSDETFKNYPKLDDMDKKPEVSEPVKTDPIAKPIVSEQTSVLPEASVEDVPPTDLSEIPAALPTGGLNAMVTAKALKTTVKFCGRWFHLVKDKTITAKEDQINYLRSCGLVK